MVEGRIYFVKDAEAESAKRGKMKAATKTIKSAEQTVGENLTISKVGCSARRVSHASGSAAEQPMEAEAVFQEGNQIMQMAVGHEDDKLYTSENDSDDEDEVEVQIMDTSLASENNSNEEEEEGEIVQEQDNSQSVNKKKTQKSNQEKIADIDLEMSKCLVELHDLMYKKGLKNSVEILKDKFPLNESTKVVKGKRNLEVSGNVNKKVKNVNKNATAKRNDNEDKTDQVNKLMTKSETTIYQSAVPKQVSSSSEEEPMDTSDELEFPRLIKVDFLVAERAYLQE